MHCIPCLWAFELLECPPTRPSLHCQPVPIWPHPTCSSRPSSSINCYMKPPSAALSPTCTYYTNTEHWFHFTTAIVFLNWVTYLPANSPNWTMSDLRAGCVLLIRVSWFQVWILAQSMCFLSLLYEPPQRSHSITFSHTSHLTSPISMANFNHSYLFLFCPFLAFFSFLYLIFSVDITNTHPL